MSGPLCPHCNVRKPTNGGRGLCRRCFNRPEIRNRYRRAVDTVGLRDQTEEELDRIIAEQRKRLPKWWAAEARRQAMGLDD